MSGIVLLRAHTRKQSNNNGIKSKQENVYMSSNNSQQLHNSLRFIENELLDLANYNEFHFMEDHNKSQTHFYHSPTNNTSYGTVNTPNTDKQHIRISKTFYPVNVDGLLMWNVHINNTSYEIVICPETFQIFLNNQIVENTKVHLSWNDQLQFGILSLQFETNLFVTSTNDKSSCQQSTNCFNYQFIISTFCLSNICLLLKHQEFILCSLQLKHLKSLMNMSMNNWRLHSICYI
ncbi:hypothetical protein KSF78_0007630 [Schistosoma japonicum]|nr:hypothetical protein KSF78_0007630 [Schistosoma japonicum]